MCRLDCKYSHVPHQRNVTDRNMKKWQFTQSLGKNANEFAAIPKQFHCWKFHQVIDTNPTSPQSTLLPCNWNLEFVLIYVQSDDLWRVATESTAFFKRKTVAKIDFAWIMDSCCGEYVQTIYMSKRGVILVFLAGLITKSSRNHEIMIF